MTTKQLIKDILIESNIPLNRMQIQMIMKEKGYKDIKKNNITQHLNRYKDLFMSTKRGFWTINYNSPKIKENVLEKLIKILIEEKISIEGKYGYKFNRDETKLIRDRIEQIRNEENEKII